MTPKPFPHFIKPAIALFGIIVASVALTALLSSRGVALDYTYQGRRVVQDFSYYLEIAHRFWLTPHTAIYRSQGPMPLGLTPVYLVVLAPLVLVRELASPLAAYATWVCCSVGVWVWVLVRLWKTAPGPLLLAAFLVAMGSARFLDTIALGQFSIVNLSLLVLLAIGELTRVPAGLAALFLASKPHHCLFTLLTMPARMRWRRVAEYGLLVSLVLVLLTPRLGFSWPMDYLHSLAVFSASKIPSQFEHAFAPHTMILFSTAFSPDAPGELHQLGGLLAVGFVLLVLLLQRRGIIPASPCLFGSAIIGGYLLFAPYCGAYDDLFLVSLFLPLTVRAWRISSPRAIVALLCLSVVLNFPYLVASPPVVWATKFALVLLLLNIQMVGERRPISR